MEGRASLQLGRAQAGMPRRAGVLRAAVAPSVFEDRRAGHGILHGTIDERDRPVRIRVDSVELSDRELVAPEDIPIGECPT